jgi:L-fuconolactonase
MNDRTSRFRSMAELARWHAASREEVLDPELPVIDAHHHLWRRPPERFCFDELMEEVSSGHNVRATVFVECNSMFKADGPGHLRPIGETEYVNGVAAISASGIGGPVRLCAGIVGYVDLRAGGSVRDVLEAHILAGGGRFRGVRQQAQFDEQVGSLARRTPPKGLLLDSAFRMGFAQLQPLGLTFDAFVYFTQLREVADLARAFPDTDLVLEHVGVPVGVGPYAGRRSDVFAEWSGGIAELAKEPNVTIKIGGLGMPVCGFGFHEYPNPPSSITLSAAWRPYVETCVEAFGAKRAMFESNFPVDMQSCSYVSLWNAYKRLAHGASDSDRRAMFHDTAQRIYRLPFESSEI